MIIGPAQLTQSSYLSPPSYTPSRALKDVWPKTILTGFLWYDEKQDGGIHQ